MPPSMGITASSCSRVMPDMSRLVVLASSTWPMTDTLYTSSVSGRAWRRVLTLSLVKAESSDTEPRFRLLSAGR